MRCHGSVMLFILRSRLLLYSAGSGLNGVWISCEIVMFCNGVMCVVNVDYLCRWQVQLYVYCARRIPAHLRYTQCLILLHLINICFLSCICLWRISQIETCFGVVVRLGLVATSPTFLRSSANHLAGPHFWLP